MNWKLTDFLLLSALAVSPLSAHAAERCFTVMAHASKFVRPGAVRIDSSNSETLLNVAFNTSQGKTVLIVANSGVASQDFSVRYKGKSLAATLGAGSVGTYIW